MAKTDGPFLALAVLCERAIEDKDGALSLIRVYQRLTATATGPEPPESMPPARHNLTLVVGFISGSARGRSNLKVRTYAPSGLRINESPVIRLLMEGDDRGANAVVNVEVVLEQEGLYWFEILLDDEPQTRVPLRVIYQTNATP